MLLVVIVVAARFSTVSLMREDAEVVGWFISYYRALGAERILIFHDGPIDHLAHIDLSAVVLRECDADFWSALGGCPEGLEDRQSQVFMHALGLCPSGWVLIVDADEFVFGDRSVAQFLDWLPESVASARLPTAEAVWGPTDVIGDAFASTCFRTAWRGARLWRLLRRAVYGEVAPYLRRGLAGHGAGKQFLRTGRRYSHIGNHHAEQDGKDISVWASSLGRSGAAMYVGHFDAISFDRWGEKWRRRVARETVATRMAGPRTAQMRAIAAALRSGVPASRRLFAQLHGLNASQFRLLSALGYVFRRDIFAAIKGSHAADAAPPETTVAEGVSP